MAKTTYSKNKVYLPREVREKLGLADGDRITIEVTGDGKARLKVTRASEAEARVLESLEDPPDLGKVKGKISREEIYEGVA